MRCLKYPKLKRIKTAVIEFTFYRICKKTKQKTQKTPHCRSERLCICQLQSIKKPVSSFPSIAKTTTLLITTDSVLTCIFLPQTIYSITFLYFCMY